jgi:hypothetical protein
MYTDNKQCAGNKVCGSASLELAKIAVLMVMDENYHHLR